MQASRRHQPNEEDSPQLSRTAGAWVLSWGILGLAHLLFRLADGVPVEGATFPVYALYEVGHFLGLGLLIGVGSGFVRLLTRRFTTSHVLGLTLLSLGVSVALVRPGVSNLATQVGGAYGVPPVLLVAITTVAVGLFVPTAWWVGRKLARWPAAVWVLLVAVALGALLNRSVLRRGNPAAHLFMAWGAVTPLAAFLEARLKVLAPTGWGRRGAVVLFGGLLAAPTLIVPPGNEVRIALAASSGSVLFPYVTPLYRSFSSPEPQPVDSGENPWLRDRSAHPDIVPTAAVDRPEAPVVVLVTVDALRADLLDREELAGFFPNLRRFRNASVDFAQARSPGAQTVYTLAMVFAARYYSQLYWTPLPDSGARDVWPHEDETRRFPELLQAAGVRTSTVLPTFWLADRFGVIRGFDVGTFEARGESVSRPGSSHWNGAPHVLDDALELVDSIGDAEPHFLYVHFVDAHEPYDDAPGADGGFDGYVRELSEVNRAVGTLLDALDRPGLANRATVIITSDHGEAFGEHDTYFHATTLYDELIRVPLMVRGPGLSPQRVETPAALMDLGPTILDLFGLPTPGAALGQSLLPMLHGIGEPPTRPIAAEGRRMRSVLFPDGLKVILNLRADTVEIYDVTSDPDELTNLAGEGDPEHADRVAFVRQFFDVHALRRPGYELPDRH